MATLANTVTTTTSGNTVTTIYNNYIYNYISLAYYTYSNRNAVRSVIPTDNDINTVLIQSLGMFRYYPGSLELDDDNTCFATSSGRWILELPHGDYINSIYSYDTEYHKDRLKELETLKESISTIQSKFLFGKVNSTITIIDPLSQKFITTTIAGASIGDNVFVTPDTDLDSRISLYARVSAQNIIKISINNSSNTSATLIPGTWGISVIKS